MSANIDIKNISFGYPRGRVVFEDLSLTIRGLGCTVLMGENGCGKTTLTKLIMGIYKPQSGSIEVFGRNTLSASLGKIGSLVGYVLQNSERQLFASTVWEEMTFPARIRGDDQMTEALWADKILRKIKLTDKKNSYPLLLSQGEKKRLTLGAVLMNNPCFVILDEPTASLDRENREILSSIVVNLKENGVGILIVTHDKVFARGLANRIIRLKGGRIESDERLHS